MYFWDTLYMISDKRYRHAYTNATHNFFSPIVGLCQLVVTWYRPAPKHVMAVAEAAGCTVYKVENLIIW
jgi:hypothetical protein